MPTGIPNKEFIKICRKCNNSFSTFSNVAKECPKCVELRKTVICENCKKLFIRNKSKLRINYCDECKKIKFYCKCGCNKELDFNKGIKGILFIKGHARKGKNNSEYHNLMISVKNKGRKGQIAWNKGLTKEIDERLAFSEERKEKHSKIALEKGFGKWMIGRKMPENTLKRLSESLVGHICSEETKNKISIANKGKNNGMYNKKHTIETKEKISKSSSEAIKNGTRHRSKYKNGQFFSIKNNKNFWYRSSYELIAFNILENNKSVIKYEVEPIIIPYDKNGINCNYVPDILVEYIDGGKEIIEIKPNIFLNDSINNLKFLAAKKYCDKNGFVFSIWTEKDLILEQV